MRSCGIAPRDNVAIGDEALYEIENIGNIGIGTRALYATTNAPRNIAIGMYAMSGNATGAGNIGIGSGVLSVNTSGSRNIAIGAGDCLSKNVTGYNNIAIGSGTLSGNTYGYSNIAIGNEAMRNSSSRPTHNIAVGEFAMRDITSGEQNIAIGRDALLEVSTGNQNIAIGYQAGGYTNKISTGQNNILLGYRATATSPTVSNEITLGNSSVATLRCQQTTITALSDARDKTDVKDLSYGIPFIQALRPVEFEWNTRDKTKVGVKDIGFIAQELDEVEQQFNSTDYTRLVYKSNPEKLEATYMRTYPILVKAVQELIQEVAGLKAKLA